MIKQLIKDRDEWYYLVQHAIYAYENATTPKEKYIRLESLQNLQESLCHAQYLVDREENLDENN